MIKKILFITLVLCSALAVGQLNGNPSPYSFYGIGTEQFQGTTENRSIGGLSTVSDSLHLNLRNPASLGKLRFVTFAVGGNHDQVGLEDATINSTASNSAFSYLALGFPVAKRVGVSFGLIPFTSVGYQLEEANGTQIDQFSGQGGLNRVFLSTGYKAFKGFTIGGSIEYNFGNIQNESFIIIDQVEFGTRETNRSDILGFTFNLGAQYEIDLSEKLRLYSSLSYIPSTSINSENQREVASVFFNPTIAVFQEAAVTNLDVADSDFEFPSAITFGLGIGEHNKWYVGGEITNQNNSSFTNRSFTLDNAEFVDATQIRFGGFYTPNFRSIRSYASRVTYRAGLRIEETGLVVNGESIDEFGISFGVGLPVGTILNNVNIGFEYGQRGTTSANLIQENIFNFNIGLSFNDIWFIKSKFN